MTVFLSAAPCERVWESGSKYPLNGCYHLPRAGELRGQTGRSVKQHYIALQFFFSSNAPPILLRVKMTRSTS
ncbi:MAG TPA: hypothetical protein DEP23_13080 [Ruminococcaceae bacterium]|nr:hypothetical protein [Oscillospiraceae bacterium]